MEKIIKETKVAVKEDKMQIAFGSSSSCQTNLVSFFNKVTEKNAKELSASVEDLIQCQMENY